MERYAGMVCQLRHEGILKSRPMGQKCAWRETDKQTERERERERERAGGGVITSLSLSVVGLRTH